MKNLKEFEYKLIIKDFDEPSDDILLAENFSLVQAMFGKLNFTPDRLYGTNGHSRYQNERNYITSKKE